MTPVYSSRGGGGGGGGGATCLFLSGDVCWMTQNCGLGKIS